MRPWRILLALAAAIGVVTAIAVPLTVAGGRDAPSPGAWNSAAEAAFAPLANEIPTMVQEEQQWESGQLSDAAYRKELAQDKSVATATSRAAASLPPYPGQPVVDTMYRASAELYIAALDADRAAVAVPPGDLRSQVVLGSERLRELANRVFDQGRVLTSQGLIPAGVPVGTRIHLPLEVPSWVEEGLAAGPPLAPTPPPADKYPPLRQGPRPTEAVPLWIASVKALHPARSAAVSRAANTLEGTALATLATRFDQSVAQLGADPDPSVGAGREVSDRLRLAWLIDEEACRAGEAAALSFSARPLLQPLVPRLLTVARAVLTTDSATLDDR